MQYVYVIMSFVMRAWVTEIAEMRYNAEMGENGNLSIFIKVRIIIYKILHYLWAYHF